jgi:hypothetical protein
MSTKLSLIFVREKFNVQAHLDSLETLKSNRALYKNTEKTYIEKVVKELKGEFAIKLHNGGNTVVNDSRQGEIIVFSDGSMAKNPLYRETITHRVARSMGQA